MKLFVVVLCVTFTSLCGVVLCRVPEFDTAVVKCSKEFNITPETTREWTDKKVEDITPTEDLKCFSKCVINESGVIQEKTVDLTVLRKLYAGSFPRFQSIIDKCKDVYKGSDTCDEAWEMLKCYYKDGN